MGGNTDIKHLRGLSNNMKDKDWLEWVIKRWIDTLEKKSVSFTDSIYEDMSDESLNTMKEKVNTEWNRRQKQRLEIITHSLET